MGMASFFLEKGKDIMDSGRWLVLKTGWVLLVLQQSDGGFLC
jgi:hypothetical protein